MTTGAAEDGANHNRAANMTTNTRRQEGPANGEPRGTAGDAHEREAGRFQSQADNTQPEHPGVATLSAVWLLMMGRQGSAVTEYIAGIVMGIILFAAFLWCIQAGLAVAGIYVVMGAYACERAAEAEKAWRKHKEEAAKLNGGRGASVVSASGESVEPDEEWVRYELGTTRYQKGDQLWVGTGWCDLAAGAEVKVNELPLRRKRNAGGAA